MTLDKDRIQINRDYPFMKNFPFDDKFEIQMAEAQAPTAFMNAGFEMVMIGQQAPEIHFNYRDSPIKATITISEKELVWISEAGKSVKKLDRIAKRLERALKSKDMLVKRDACLEADEWMSSITDGRNILSKQIMNDALNSIVGPVEVADAVSLANHLTKLFMKTGFIHMTKREGDIITTFLQFKLIYTKLLLGIVISSKITL
jgi:hypothetical protein